MRDLSAAAKSNRCVALGLSTMLGVLIVGVASDARSTEPAVAQDAANTASAANSCHAKVVPVGLNVKQCPLASLHFHVSVADCKDSKGSFVYQYLLVSEGIKDTVQHTVPWTAHGHETDLTERVPAACDQEVDGTEVKQVIDCTCSKR